MRAVERAGVQPEAHRLADAQQERATAQDDLLALLGAGVAMESKDLSPIETGKRLVDVVDEKFA